MAAIRGKQSRKKSKAVEKVEPKKGGRRKDILQILISEYGDGVIWTFDGKTKDPEVEIIPTKTLSLNWALGRGGFPRGRITEISGPESSGKSSLCFHAISSAQRTGGRCAYIDVENSLEIDYMRQCGVDEKNNFILAQPDYGEEALDMVEKIILDNRTDIVVVDSVAALIPKAELEGDMTDMQVGLQARMLAKSMRRLNIILKGSKTAVIFTNQLRDKIGGFGFGPQTSTPGGRALKHSAAIRLETRRTTPIKSKSKQVGFMTRIKVMKNKVAPPFREVQVPIMFGYGIDDRLDLIDLSVKAKALSKKGGIFYAGDKPIGNGWLEVYKKVELSERLKTVLEAKINKMFDKWSDLGSSVSATNEVETKE